MFPFSSSPSHFIQAQALHETISSRKLLQQTQLYQPPSSLSGDGNGHASPESTTGEFTFDANVAMILAALLCALICALGLNSIIRCAFRCSTRIAFESREHEAARLANTGVKRKALKTFPTLIYSAELKLPGLDTECPICLSEFIPGERIRVLPKCNHGFHVRCIDKWLISHSSCPTCRHCLLNIQKLVGSSQPGPQEPPPPALQLVSLEPEGPTINYRGIY